MQTGFCLPLSDFAQKALGSFNERKAQFGGVRRFQDAFTVDAAVAFDKDQIVVVFARAIQQAPGPVDFHHFVVLEKSVC